MIHNTCLQDATEAKAVIKLSVETRRNAIEKVHYNAYPSGTRWRVPACPARPILYGPGDEA